jgi:predicted RNase H-like HicB family nuclease
MTREVSFTAVYENVEQGWVQARVRELPEVIKAAPTLDKAKELLLDALVEHLRSLGAHENRRLVTTQPITEGKLAISLSA